MPFSKLAIESLLTNGFGFLSQTFGSLMAPFYYIFDPTKRLFFLYLLVSGIVAFAVVFVKTKTVDSVFKTLFNRRVWLHPSSKTDMQLLFFNSVLRFVIFLLVFQGSLSLTKAVVRLLNQYVELQSPWQLSYGSMVAIYSVVSFVALDFSRFLQHYLFHKVPFLWRFHKVHHSAEVLTPITLYRTHPVESLVSGVRRIAVVGLVSGVFVFYTQSLIGAYAIFGVNAFDFVFNIFGSNLRHSHIWLSFGPINHLFVSPAQHQIHHSRALRHRDKNFGFAFSVWDKLFGSFHQVRFKKEFVIFGVQGETHRSLRQALMAPRTKPTGVANPIKVRIRDNIAVDPGA